jgi:hypothetical protein
VDWSFVKQIAASFVKGLDKKRGEMTERIVNEVTEALGVSQAAGQSGDALVNELPALEQALSKVREARDAQVANEKSINTVVRRAMDTWTEASVATISATLQKELGKLSEGVAGTLALQLAQSRKFCEAVARAVQKSGAGASKHALEALRPPRQLQDLVGAALGDALNDALAPVFRQELRAHFEQELGPLIAQRVGEMMTQFRDKMGECLEGIASEHEQVAKRLAADIAPVVAEELAQVERSLAATQASSGTAAATLSEAQLDGLASAMQEEIVQPLQARIQDLSSQVRTLREEARELERRYTALSARSGSGSSDVMPPMSRLAQQPPVETEEQQAVTLERMFRDGRKEDAFMKAIERQPKAQQVDFLGRVCALVPEGSIYEWLAGESSDGRVEARPLGPKARVCLMCALAKQLLVEGDGGLKLEWRSNSVGEVAAVKLEWLSQLWLVFDAEELGDTAAATFSNQFLGFLEQCRGDLVGSPATQLRTLKTQVRATIKLLQPRPRSRVGTEQPANQR